MKVFISWSGERSRRVADTLRDTLPLIQQSIEPWTSSKGLDPGTRWATNIEFELRRSAFAVVCVTPENLNSPWIQFEVGALQNAVGSASICPYLIGFKPADLRGPLVQFQAVEATHDGTWRLVQSLNQRLDNQALEPGLLRQAFEAWWPRIAAHIEDALAADVPEGDLSKSVPARPTTDRQLLEEILKRLSSASEQKVPTATVSDSSFVFLVHGRAHRIAETVARFVEKLGPKVVILYEQPNQGRTVIEKFEDHSQVPFAIVLMTGDDRGGLKEAAYEEQEPRARQNVVFELGYFIARIGRQHVVVLHEQGVELPSDYTGVVYVPLDSGDAWRLALARELRAAGLRVDLNNLV